MYKATTIFLLNKHETINKEIMPKENLSIKLIVKHQNELFIGIFIFHSVSKTIFHLISFDLKNFWNLTECKIDFIQNLYF